MVEPSRPTFISETLWTFLAPVQRELIADAFLIDEQVPQNTPLNDFAFMVFPIAKAYEGFLKDYFLRLGVLPHANYVSRRFRIGRSLNPDIVPAQRDEDWLFDDVEKHCGHELALALWEVWLEGRNHIFHYFPDDKYETNRVEARAIQRRLIDVMERAVLCVGEVLQ